MQPYNASVAAGWQHLFVNTNDIRLHCVTQGEGELVILLHGFPEFWYSWRHQIPALARHFKVVVPDLRGYNYSDKPDSGYDLDTLSRDILGSIAAFGYSKAHIVGHDWGGTIAWHLAERFPDSIDKLAILNAAHPQKLVETFGNNFEKLLRNWYILAAQVPGIPEWLIRQNLKEFVLNIFRGQAIRKAAFGAEDLQIYQDALSKPGAIGAALSHYRQAFSAFNWLPQLSQSLPYISVPTLVLWGEEDALLSKNLTKEMASFVRAPFELKLIPNCGHWIQQEVPQTVNRELLKFLRTADS
jgi:epoxide hydrolase 4